MFQDDVCNGALDMTSPDLQFEYETRYDVQNFCFPVPSVLENHNIRLVPFTPSIHARPFTREIIPHPELFDYLPFGPFVDVRDFMENLYIPRVHNDPGYVLFIMFDKNRARRTGRSKHEDLDADQKAINENIIQAEGNQVLPSLELAGLIGLINTSRPHLRTEVGFIVILPRFQRTYVARTAVGLLLHYALDPPPLSLPFHGTRTESGLGLRRVVWHANAANLRSSKLAELLGFTREGMLRWHMVLSPGKIGLGTEDGTDAGAGESKDDGAVEEIDRLRWVGPRLREGDLRPHCPGRHTVVLGLCWDDWEGVIGGADHDVKGEGGESGNKRKRGVRLLVDRLMNST